MGSFIVSILTIAVFLVAGLWCLTQARRMQRRAIKASEELKLNLFRGYINSRSYVIVARVTGAACIAIALLLAFLMIRS